MRRPLIAGNWKMNLNGAQAVALAQGVARGAASVPHVDLAVFPPFVYLPAVRTALENSRVSLGAQNLYAANMGAYTGEVCAAMLLDVGCTQVILGHSERRTLLGESDADVNLKTKAALAAGLTPVVCVGESKAQRESGQTTSVVRGQAERSLAGLSAEEMTKTVLAYEPVWAIGTGLTATPEQAQEVHKDLRNFLAERYNAALANGVRILYGGSVKADNAASLLSRPDIDGALVGGASLKSEEFLAIAKGAPA